MMVGAGRAAQGPIYLGPTGFFSTATILSGAGVRRKVACMFWISHIVQYTDEIIDVFTMPEVGRDNMM